MWGSNGTKMRHFFGRQNGNPLAICGHKGAYPLSFTRVTAPKCRKCLDLEHLYRKPLNKEDNQWSSP